jgi:hypothetical protein
MALREAVVAIKNIVYWSEKPSKQVGRFKGSECDSPLYYYLQL